jgi:hypothetical protein
VPSEAPINYSVELVAYLDVVIIEDGDQVPHEGVVGVQPAMAAEHFHLEVLLRAVHQRANQLQDELVLDSPLLSPLLVRVPTDGRVGRLVERQQRPGDATGDHNVKYYAQRL